MISQRNNSQERFEIRTISGECIEVTSRSRGHRKSNSSTSDETHIVAILDRHEHRVKTVWDESWTEVAPGIKTRCDTFVSPPRYCVNISRQACPAGVRVSRRSEYVDFDHTHSSSHSESYWVYYTTNRPKPAFPKALLRQRLKEHLRDFCQAFHQHESAYLEASATPRAISQLRISLNELWKTDDLIALHHKTIPIVDGVMFDENIKASVDETWELKYHDKPRQKVRTSNLYTMRRIGEHWMVDSCMLLNTTRL